ncbi:predicted protein [Naegleria gruberi]|uniref:Predicted protein n=1 Tax=Naegleria gruberi TaxID=5762 RepID=D2VYH7_NAEGR|nr:uncharacterized protein NAEGRDRAFT_74125 [Naegleria gruberi]EFC38062.1 predicted protein [Naegleria gruberi]|eukprot:XP_002670806.1 predicted protein [Naegleria gruberi strain NEG-M]
MFINSERLVEYVNKQVLCMDTCHALNLLFVGLYSLGFYMISIFENGVLKRTMEISDRFVSFQVDEQAEFIYLLSNGNCGRLTKMKLDDTSIVWHFNSINSFCLAGNEIYVGFSCKTYLTVHILDTIDGSQKKQFTVDKGMNTFILKQMKYYERKLYLLFHKCGTRNIVHHSNLFMIVDLITEKTQPIKLEKTLSTIGITTGGLLIFFGLWDVDVYDINSRLLLGINYSQFQSKCFLSACANHFDKHSNRYYIHQFEEQKNQKDEIIQISSSIVSEQLEISMNVVDAPLNSKIWQAIEKLGGQLPQYIPQDKISYRNLNFEDSQYSIYPDCLEYLLRVDFGQVGFWYKDKEITKNFTFEKEAYVDWVRKKRDNELFFATPFFHNQGMFLYVKKEELSNNDDFPVHLLYQTNDENNQHEEKVMSLLEFLSRLSLAEHVILNTGFEYFINFEMICKELLEKNIIDPETRQLDIEYLIKNFEGANMYLKIYFNNSKFRFGNSIYEKLFLILTANDCSKNCLIEMESEVDSDDDDEYCIL